MAKRDIWVRTFTLFAVESGLVISAVLLSLYWRLHSEFGTTFGEVVSSSWGIVKVLIITFVCQFIFYLFGLYDISTARSRRDLFASIVQAVAVAWIVLGLIFLLIPQTQMLFGYSDRAGEPTYVENAPITAMVMTLFFMICWRVVIHWLLSHPALSERILIVGTGASAVELAREVLSRRDLGYRVVGFVSEDKAEVGRSLFNPSVVGVVEQLNEIVERERVDRVVVALSDRRGHLPVDQLLQLRLQGSAVIEEGTSLYERVTGRISVEMLRPSWIIFSGGSKRSRIWLSVRRGLNVLFAVIGLVLSFPLWILTALAIKLESPGPVFYRQERVGKNGRIFTIIKFRSMRQDAEKSGPVWAAKEDDRTTRVGRFIRKVRIDELPQFINILKGEMAFVGPRPERPFFVEQLNDLIPFYSQRHLVEPGVTGWAQVRYDYGASVEDALQKLQYDLYYIKNASLLFDLWIMLESIKIILFGRGR
ncbi:MAG TPA: TIGR03013 family XrtA/PEP-CTERM system glycosyltransferase [Blastocatellia bacterium]|nr:TIGR03013 family XrtA/PEP-CTERM system glycosyltransferase [Blastocatellia bacterium]